MKSEKLRTGNLVDWLAERMGEEMTFVSRICRVLKRDGVRWTFIRLVARILKQPLEIQQAKDKIWSSLLEKYDYKVAYGPFKGMLLNKDVWWSKNDRITQTLGVYEEHVMHELIEFGHQNNKLFIDIGAADGYFAVGMACSKIFEKVYAFEISPEGQEKIRGNALRNYCDDRVFVWGEANYDSLKNVVEHVTRSVVLLDIEGFEYEFLTTEMLTLLRDCNIICELHPWLVEGGYGKQKNLIDNASGIFDVSLVQRSSYCPNKFEELSEFSDEERLIAFGEGRGKNMEWLVLKTKCKVLDDV